VEGVNLTILFLGFYYSIELSPHSWVLLIYREYMSLHYAQVRGDYLRIKVIDGLVSTPTTPSSNSIYFKKLPPTLKNILPIILTQVRDSTLVL